MQSAKRRRRAPAAAQVLLTVAAVCLVSAGYLALLRASIDLEWVVPATNPDRRDAVYLGLQAVVTAASVLFGYAVGRLSGGLGFAYAVLFGLLAILLGIVAHLGSYSLACDGHNDVIRHWTC